MSPPAPKSLAGILRGDALSQPLKRFLGVKRASPLAMRLALGPQAGKRLVLHHRRDLPFWRSATGKGDPLDNRRAALKFMNLRLQSYEPFGSQGLRRVRKPGKNVEMRQTRV